MLGGHFLEHGLNRGIAHVGALGEVAQAGHTEAMRVRVPFDHVRALALPANKPVAFLGGHSGNLKLLLGELVDVLKGDRALTVLGKAALIRVHREGNLNRAGDGLILRGPGDVQLIFRCSYDFRHAVIGECSTVRKGHRRAHVVRPAVKLHSRGGHYCRGVALGSGGVRRHRKGIGIIVRRGVGPRAIAIVKVYGNGGDFLSLGPAAGDLDIAVVDLALTRISPAAESIGVALGVLYFVAVSILVIYLVLIAGLQVFLTLGKRYGSRRITIPVIGDAVALLVIRFVIPIGIYRPHGVEGGGLLINGKDGAHVDHAVRHRAVGADILGRRLAPAHERVTVPGQTIDVHHRVVIAGPDLIDGHGARHSIAVGIILHGIGNRNLSAFDVRDCLLRTFGIRVADAGRRICINICPRRRFLGLHGENDGLRLLGNGVHVPGHSLAANGHTVSVLSRNCKALGHLIGKGCVGAGGQLILGDLISDILNQLGEVLVDGTQIRKVVGIVNLFFLVIRGRKLLHELTGTPLQPKTNGIDLCAVRLQSSRVTFALPSLIAGLAIRDEDDVGVLRAVLKISLSLGQARVVVGSVTNPIRIHIIDRIIQRRYARFIQGGQCSGSVRHNRIGEGHNTDPIIWIGLSKRVHQGLSRALGGAHFGDFSSAVLVARIRPIIHFTAGIAGPIVAKPSIVLCVARRGALSGSIQHAGGVIHHHHHIESIGGCGGSLYVLSADVQRNLHISGLFIVLSGLPCLDFARLKLFCSGRRRLRRKGGGGQECQHHGEDQEC